MGKVTFDEPLGPGFSEDQTWSARVRPLLDGWPENVVQICAYGVTEMLNNANDHSSASSVRVQVDVRSDSVEVLVVDAGIGIFQHIMTKLNLDDIRHAVFELTKGKVTTDPERHTGEGVFYTSRMFDEFALYSSGIHLGRFEDDDEDWVLGERDASQGTVVRLMINRSATRTMKEVFSRYSVDQDDYGFKRTTVGVRLSHEGDTLVSRSQAKRVVAGLEKFKEVVLNFDGIADVSPAFADEIFRVFARAHPHLTITPIEANDDVARMIRKAQADAAATEAK